MKVKPGQRTVLKSWKTTRRLVLMAREVLEVLRVAVEAGLWKDPLMATWTRALVAYSLSPACPHELGTM